MLAIAAQVKESAFRKGSRTLTSRIGLIAIVLVVFFAWWLIPQTGLVTPYVLPPLFDVITEMGREAYLAQLSPTLIEVFLGFALGVSAGISIGTLAAYSERAKRAVTPVALIFASIMKSLLAPLFVLWVGYGLGPMVVVAALICFFPVLISTLDGLSLVEYNFVEMMNSIQASRWHIYKKLRFPNALPRIFDGLKISAALAVIGAVVAEFIIGMRGVGTMLQMGTHYANNRIVYASVLWMALMGIVLYLFVLVVQRLLLPPPLRRKEI